MKLYKMCTRCKRKIEVGKSCSSCNANTNKVYDCKSRNDDSRKFYHSKDWVSMRDRVMNKYNHLDLYELKNNNKIVPADIVHHIIELSEDMSKGLLMSNLIPVSIGTHNYIHSVYNKSLKDKKELQEKLLSFIKN